MRAQVLVIDDPAVPGRFLPLRRDLFDHSTEFNWGYPGSGPAQLALALLADHLGRDPNGDQRAVDLHQAFKWAVIGNLRSRVWALNGEDIDAALDRLRRFQVGVA